MFYDKFYTGFNVINVVMKFLNFCFFNNNKRVINISPPNLGEFKKVGIAPSSTFSITKFANSKTAINDNENCFYFEIYYNLA